MPISPTTWYCCITGVCCKVLLLRRFSLHYFRLSKTRGIRLINLPEPDVSRRHLGIGVARGLLGVLALALRVLEGALTRAGLLSAKP